MVKMNKEELSKFIIDTVNEQMEIIEQIEQIIEDLKNETGFEASIIANMSNTQKNTLHLKCKEDFDYIIDTLGIEDVVINDYGTQWEYEVMWNDIRILTLDFKEEVKKEIERGA